MAYTVPIRLVESSALKQFKPSAWLLIPLCLTLLSACSSKPIKQLTQVTRINAGHSLIQTDQSRPHATVYFIRPKTEHPTGYPDNPLEVDVDGEQLMKLGKAEYTLVYLKPREVSITLRDITQVRGRWELTEMARTRQFNLQEGETYFILTDMINGEFRGVIFIPKALSKFEAKNIARHLVPVGEAELHPITKL
jgi:hypothetical protein